MNPQRVGEGCFGVSSDYLISLSEQAFERGLSVGDLLDGTGLAGSALLLQDSFIGHVSFLRAMRNFCRYDGNFWTALEGGRRMTLSKHGYVGYAAQHSRTLEEAADKLFRYVSTRIELFELQRGDRADDVAELRLRPRVDDGPTVNYVSLNFLVCLETLCRQILGRNAANMPSTITLTGPAPETPMPPLPANSRILFNAPCFSLRWPIRILMTEIPSRDEDLARLAEARCENDLRRNSEMLNLGARVRQQLNFNDQVLPQVDEVAARLNMSVATLKRKLKAEGESFQQIKDRERLKQAEALLLQGGLNVDQIAERLGYSDASNFSKAFKSWTGATPSQFRKAKE